MKQPPPKLMIPGPIQPADDVLEALGGPVQVHYGSEWAQYYNETTELLRPVFGTDGSIFLMVGAGTVAIDAALGSLLSSGEKVIVGKNGFFGDRLETVANSYGLSVVPVQAEWGQPLTAEAIDAALRAHPDARAVAAVHLETSTSVINPIEAIGQVCRRRGAAFFVDAVSSLGGLPVKMDEWGIDVCASASQKCLGSVPGLAPVAVGKRGWECIDRNPQKGHGWYGDLRVWQKHAVEWRSWHPFPITMPTNSITALHTSLTSLMEEGIETRLERYTQLALRLRAGLRRVGMPPFTPDEVLAPVLTAARVPEGVKSSQVVNFLVESRGIRISTGLGELRDQIIRIGHMSPVVTAADIDAVIDALAAFKPG